jgi:hypothetical protein
VISFQGKNNAGTTKHFGGIKGYSAGAELGELAFNVRKSSSEPEHEAMRIDSDGNVGIGTASPDATLHISSPQPVIRLTDTTPATDTVSQIWADSDTSGSLMLAADITNVGTDPFVSFRVGGLGLANEKMRIDSAGNVGIGTTSPDEELHIEGGNSPYIKVEASDNTDSGIALAKQSVNKWFILNDADQSDNFAIRGDGGGTDEFLTIKQDGNVGIGTTDPAQKLVVESGQADWVTKLINTNASPSGLAIQFAADIANASNDFIRCFKNTSDIRFRVYSNGTVLANATEYSSDDRVKHNEQPIIGALETLSKITPKKYIKTTEIYDANHDFELDADGNPVDSNGEPVEHRIEAGVIAQQVLTVDELAFAVSPESVDEDGTVTSPHGLDYNSLFTYAIAAIQEQQQTIEDLKSQNESQQSTIDSLVSRIKNLENK